jgi:hypothetical protein
MEDLEGQICEWVDAIMRHNYHDLSFDEIYSTTYYSTCPSAILDSICATFGDIVAQFRDEMPTNTFTEFEAALHELCPHVEATIDILSSLFCSLDDARVRSRLLNIFKTTIFESFGPMQSFLRIYSRTLPGTRDIDSERPLIVTLLNFLPEMNEWSLFVECLVDATDSLCLEISSRAISRTNAITYLGLVQEVIAHEERFWCLLPSEVSSRLRATLITGLVTSVRDDALFYESSRPLWSQYFFENSHNFTLFADVYRTLLTDTETRAVLQEFLVAHFISRVECLADEMDGKWASVSGACRIAEELVDIFERTSLLPFPGHLRGALLADVRLKVERCIAVFIGRCIETICEEPHKQQNFHNIHKCAAIVQNMPDRREFVRVHAHYMLVRLFQLAGKQYRLEAMVLNFLQPFVPPTLSKPFEDRIREFGESENINREWSKKKPMSPLQILLLPSSKSNGIIPSFTDVNLPEPFARMQAEFESFYLQRNQNQKKKLVWMFEDNIVNLELTLANKVELTLRSPLLFAMVLKMIIDYTEPTLDFLAAESKLTTRQVEYLVKRVTNTEFPLLLLAESGKVMINQQFESKQKKRYVIVTPAFSLRTPPRSETEREAMSRNVYEAQIIRVLKNSRDLAEDELLKRSKAKITALLGAFKDSEYERAIIALESRKFICKDPSRSNRWLYVT